MSRGNRVVCNASNPDADHETESLEMKERKKRFAS